MCHKCNYVVLLWHCSTTVEKLMPTPTKNTKRDLNIVIRNHKAKHCLHFLYLTKRCNDLDIFHQPEESETLQSSQNHAKEHHSQHTQTSHRVDTSHSIYSCPTLWFSVTSSISASRSAVTKLFLNNTIYPDSYNSWGCALHTFLQQQQLKKSTLNRRRKVGVFSYRITHKLNCDLFVSLNKSSLNHKSQT